ncbi:MAG TPA: Hint domain-containing protein [Xanthobacteraceae bacterium]|nr:Hint domain-containing protein [Xanthobacteraceae bacterium]
MVLTYYGQYGAPGTYGVNPGESGTAGQTAPPLNYTFSNPNIQTKITGGAGGAGGYAAVGGSAGAGGDGGYVYNYTKGTYNSTNGLYTYQAVVGGKGGDAGSYYSSPGRGANGGNGGATVEYVSAVNNTGNTNVHAYATGGAGGAGIGKYSGGGAGGAASVKAYGAGVDVVVGVYQTGGAGGAGIEYASAARGADSSLFNAVSGRTSGGELGLKQTATGGAGGDGFRGGVAGAGGNATSSLSFNDTINPVAAKSLYGKSTATGGAGGAGELGYANGAMGGEASASVTVIGAPTTVIDSFGDAAGAFASATGGAGGPGNGGGAGGAATGAHAVAIALGAVSGRTYARSDETGGSGGNGYGLGNSGGAGGAASGSSAYASGFSAVATVQQTGGAGGKGHNGVAGGSGGNSDLTNAVSGRTSGGYLELIQGATGGSGGSSYGADAGGGGTASASLVFDDAVNPVAASFIKGVSSAYGGNGGSVYSGGAGNGGTGGTGQSSIALTGSSIVKTYADASGGTGGRGYGSGKHGGAGGTASAAHSYASGFSARAAAYQRGGSGGGGTGGADGGAGAASTLTNAVTGRTTGGYLQLNQVAVGGAGGNSDGAIAGAGGAATSSFTFDDVTANPIAASSLSGRAVARGGAGGGGGSSGIAGGGGAASVGVDVTGAFGVTALGYAHGGQGGSIAGGYGAPGGSAYTKAFATSKGLGQSNTATAHANAYGGAGSIVGSANANASSNTANGQQAESDALAQGSTGYAMAASSTGGAGAVISAQANAVAPAGGTATAKTLADAGAVFSFDAGSHDSAYSFATELPSAETVNDALASHANVEAVLGLPAAFIFGAATQGGAYSPNASGTVTYKSSSSWLLDTSQLQGDLDIGLLDEQTSGSGFDSIELEIDAGGGQLFDQGFTSLALAQAFFTDDVLDLGALAGAPGLEVAVNFTLVTSSPDSGFSFDYFIGTAPPVTAFEANVATASGSFEGDYLWSNPDNWSLGAVASGDAVTITGGPAVSVDDVSGLQLPGITLADNATLLVAAETLTIDVVSGSADVTLLEADAADAGGPVTVTVGNITGQGGEYEAKGAGAEFIDQGSTDPGETFIAADGGLVELSGTPNSASVLEFSGDGTFAFTDPGPTIDAAVTNFGAGDSIELPGQSIESVSFGDHSIDITTDAGSTLFTDVTFAGTFSGYQAGFDSATGLASMTLTENPPCYCRGTLIATARGETPVESLRIGDTVKTASGRLHPIKWIGKRSYGGRFVAGRKDILPVCISAGALNDGVPMRDLWISPHHAMYFEDEGGLLIEAKDLVNGVSIVQAERVESVEYFHVELESHDVILAEGAPSETFIDDDSRGMFHNAREYRALYPDEAARAGAHYCAPRLEEGYGVEAVRRRVVARAGLLRSADAARAGALRGFVDLISADSITGWAQDQVHLEAPVCLDIFAEGRLIGQVLANRYREDLERVGLGSGRHGFSFTPAHGVSRGGIEVRRSLDGALLQQAFNAKATRAPNLEPRPDRRPIQVSIIAGARSRASSSADDWAAAGNCSTVAR